MDKLNNEELNKVSAGRYDDVPGLEYAELYLHNHGGHCKDCGTPVTEFEPFSGPNGSCGEYDYVFLCKCPYPRNLAEMIYYQDRDLWYIPDQVVQ